jgi:DNA-binding protein YbaB
LLELTRVTINNNTLHPEISEMLHSMAAEAVKEKTPRLPPRLAIAK